MNKLDSHRAFADSRGHALNGTVAHVAYCENARNVRLQEKRIAVGGPALGPLPALHDIGPGENESALVAFDQARQPVRLGQSSDEDEHDAGWHMLNLVGVGAEYGDSFEMFFAMNFGDAGVPPDLNVRRLLNLVDEVLRHGAGQRVSANQHHYLLRILGKIHRRLAGGVRTTHNVDSFSRAR